MPLKTTTALLLKHLAVAVKLGDTSARMKIV